MPSEFYVDSLAGYSTSGTNIVAGIITATAFVGPGISTAAVAIAEDGSPLGSVSTLDFVGAGVTVAVVGDVATIAVSGGGTGGGVSDILAGTGIAVTNTGTVYTITNTGGSGGISTYADRAGIATYANTAGISSNADHATQSSYASLSGFTTFAFTARFLEAGGNIDVGVITATNLYAPGSNLTGITTNIIAGAGITIFYDGGNATIFGVSTAGIATEAFYAVTAGYSTNSGLADRVSGYGGNGALQFSSSGIVTGSSLLSFDSSKSILSIAQTSPTSNVVLNLDSGTYTGIITSSAYLTLNAGSDYGVSLTGGTGETSPGSVNIEGGDYIGLTSTALGGEVYIRAGGFNNESTVGVGNSVVIWGGRSQIGTVGGGIVLNPGQDDDGLNPGSIYIAPRGGNVILPNISNVKVSGGSSGQVIQTDGSGNLSFVDNGSGGGINTAFVDGRIAANVGIAYAGITWNPTLPNLVNYTLLYSVTPPSVQWQVEGPDGSGSSYVSILTAEGPTMYFYDGTTGLPEVTITGLSWNNAGNAALSNSINVSDNDINYLISNAVSSYGADSVDTLSQTITWLVNPINVYTSAPEPFAFQPDVREEIVSIASTLPGASLYNIIDIPSSPYSIASTEAGTSFYTVSTTSSVTINLPSSVGLEGRTIYIKDITGNRTNPIVINGNLTETIDGQSSFSITGNYNSISLIGLSSSWGVY